MLDNYFPRLSVGLIYDDWTTGKTATCAGLAFAWRFGVFGYQVLVKFLGERASWISLLYFLQIRDISLSQHNINGYIYPVDYTATGRTIERRARRAKRKDIRCKGPQLHTALSLTVQIPDNIISSDTLKHTLNFFNDSHERAWSSSVGFNSFLLSRSVE